MDKFWRWFNPPLPDVMQAEMLRDVKFSPRLTLRRQREIEWEAMNTSQRWYYSPKEDYLNFGAWA